MFQAFDQMVSTVMEEEIAHFFRGLSKLTLELSPSNSSSLRSCNDHFALGWVESFLLFLIKIDDSKVATTISL